jgi:hypothetical protein
MLLTDVHADLIERSSHLVIGLFFGPDAPE